MPRLRAHVPLPEAHIWQAHRLRAEEYKVLFVLNVTTRLVVPAGKEWFAGHAQEVFAGHTEGRSVCAVTPAECSALAR